jgi:PQQ-like domain
MRNPSFRTLVLIAIMGLSLVGCNGTTTAPAPHSTSAVHAPSPAIPTPIVVPTPTSTPVPDSLPGMAAALPATPRGVPFTGHLLISENSGSGRIIEIDASGHVTWAFPDAGSRSSLGPWDDAFYTPDLRTIIANSEEGQTVIAIDIASHDVQWVAGEPNRIGAGSSHFNSPDDAVPAPDGTIQVADIRNCRIVHLSASGQYLGSMGNGACYHAPPNSFGSPNGAFPTSNGNLVVTEIHGSWVDLLSSTGSLIWASQAPVSYPSDALAYPDGTVLLTDYVSPGKVIRMTSTGRVVWYYAPGDVQTLNHPSIAIPLASNRVAICDDYNNRVLIVDPTNNSVVAVYSSPGGVALQHPDGLAYRPN